MDAASLVFDNHDGRKDPTEGDFSLCMNCGTPFRRHGDRWCRMTAAEFATIPPENRRQITLAQTAITEAGFPDLSLRRRR
jgi:hypothetical protein